MGILDRLFGSSNQTTTTTVDPWSKMPPRLKKAFMADLQFRQNQLLQPGRKLARRLAKNPRQIEGLSAAERSATSNIVGAGNEANRRTGNIAAGLDDFEVPDAPAAFDNSFAGPGKFNTGPEMDVAQNFGTVEGPSDVDIAALQEQYESGYTDDVVDTTLAGIQRAGDRERLRAESQGAAIGGTSNTRSAVAQMLGQESTARTMAENEAQLRDEAFRYSREMGLKHGEANRDWELDQSNFDLDLLGQQRQYGLDRAGFNLDKEQARTGFNMDRAKFRLDRADTVHGAGLDDYEAMLAGEKARTGYGLDRADLLEALNSAGYGRTVQGQGLRGEMGGLGRSIRQQRKDARRAAGQDALSWLSSLYTGSDTKGAPPVGQTSATAQPGPSPFSQVLGTAAQAASIYTAMPSDPEIKEDVETPKGSALDKLEKMQAYSYRYKEGEGHVRHRTSGLMADEVEKAGIEGAVHRDHRGVRHVDIYPVVATIVQAVNELKNYDQPGAGLG